MQRAHIELVSLPNRLWKHKPVICRAGVMLSYLLYLSGCEWEQRAEKRAHLVGLKSKRVVNQHARENVIVNGKLRRRVHYLLPATRHLSRVFLRNGSLACIVPKSRKVYIKLF
jgi:hypothetical protein